MSCTNITIWLKLRFYLDATTNLGNTPMRYITAADRELVLSCLLGYIQGDAKQAKMAWSFIREEAHV